MFLIFVLSIFPLICRSKIAPIYLTNSEDSSSSEFFDCFIYEREEFCRRPTVVAALKRDETIFSCSNGGIKEKFVDLEKNSSQIQTILHEWRSSMEKLSDWIFSSGNGSNDEFLCRCNEKSFGKFCEYELFSMKSLQELFSIKFSVQSGKLNFLDEFVCYSTIECDSGLLCLDWRDVCDGISQCAEGFDEMFCDEIFSVRCDDDEYRCQNKLCVPKQFLLDGQIDCLDGSDERNQIDDAKCPYQLVSSLCDDRFLPRTFWSCGDGQKITRRVLSVRSSSIGTCANRRDQLFWCETVQDEILWTEENGRCTSRPPKTIKNRFQQEICRISSRHRRFCPPGNFSHGNLTNQTSLHYPNGWLLFPGVFSFFDLLEAPKNGTFSWRIRKNFSCPWSNSSNVDFIVTDNQFLTDFFEPNRFINCGKTSTIDDSSCEEKIKFSCEKNQTRCLSIDQFGDGRKDCPNSHDEFWFGTKNSLSSMFCDEKSQKDCEILQNYICNSSYEIDRLSVENSNNFSLRRFPFQFYCNSINDFPNREDENQSICQDWVCSNAERCQTGQCIQKSWLFDEQWDCLDGSDEENYYVRPVKQKVIQNPNFELKYPPNTTWSKCFSDFNMNCQSTRELCFNVTDTNGEDLEAPKSCSELNVLEFCAAAMTRLGFQFECLSMKTCLNYSMEFRKTFNISNPCRSDNDSHFRCWDENRFVQRCNEIAECSLGEDEFLCELEFNAADRSKKIYEVKQKGYRNPLDLFPEYLQSNFSLNETSLQRNEIKTGNVSLSISHPIINRCNRGILMNFNNSQTVCFCPAQYHGDQCQFHTDRVRVLLQVNYDHSPYNKNTNSTIVHKFLVLLLLHDEILMNRIFHIRPVEEIASPTKTSLYFHFSRKEQFLDNRKKRFFNIKNEKNQTHYRLRIELFEMKHNEKPSRLFVWLYRVHFGILPVSQITKILRFKKDSHKENLLCRDKRQNHSKCYAVQNKWNESIHLCDENYGGKNCQTVNHQCLNRFCSNLSVCQPDYRGVVADQELPFCICEMNKIGYRCSIEPGACASNPCQNGGSCFQRGIPDQYRCRCLESFSGKHCQEKLPTINVQIENRLDQNFQAAIIYHLDINTRIFRLEASSKTLLYPLKNRFSYDKFRKEETQIIIFRAFSYETSQLHLIAVLTGNHSLNQRKIVINEQNQCEKLGSLSKFDEHRC